MSMGAILGVAGCGGSTTTTPTPTPVGGIGLPTIPGLPVGGNPGSAPAASSLLSASDVQGISGDTNVAPVSGACTANSCVYADTSGTGGGGGGLDASATGAPEHAKTAAVHAAASARSPMPDLKIPTSTATFEPEMSITSSLLQPDNASSCASHPLTPTGSTLQSRAIIPRFRAACRDACGRSGKRVSTDPGDHPETCVHFQGNCQEIVSTAARYPVILRRSPLGSMTPQILAFCGKW